MNYQHIRAFYAVAKEGTVSQAARRLGVSQPTLSQQIKALEERYQTHLFERSRRRLMLTETGKHLFSLSQRLMATAQEIDEAFEQAVSLETGSLRIAADGPAHAASLLAEFRTRYPHPSVAIQIGNARDVLEQVLAAQVDVAVVVDPPAIPGLHYLPLAPDPLEFVLPRGHRLAGLKQIPFPEVANETLIIRENRSRTRALLLAALESEGVEPRDMVEVSTREAIREVVARNVGISFFARSECAPDERLVSRPIAPIAAPIVMTTFVVCHEDRKRLGILRAFLELSADYARRWAASQPPQVTLRR